MNNSVEQGYRACLGLAEQGSFGGVLVLAGRDKEFLEVPKGLS